MCNYIITTIIIAALNGTHKHKAVTLNIKPIRDFILPFTDKFFAHCLSHPNPIAQQTENYALAEQTDMYRKYNYKRTKHILLQLAKRKLQCFLCIIFHCRYWHFIYRAIHKSLRNFRTRLRNNQERQGRKEHINR